MGSKSNQNPLEEGLSILRNKGIFPLAKAFLSFVGLNYQGYSYYTQHLYRTRATGSVQGTDPFTVISVPSEAIQRTPAERISRWDHFGEALPGDWDQETKPVCELIKYRSVVDRFKNDVPWEETDVYQEAVKRIKNGETYWNGCRTIKDVERRTQHVDELYDRIKMHGYKSQGELHGKPLRDVVLDRKFDRSKEEVAVAIGRDGEFLFIDGTHRLAIAHVLQLDEIPVHVVFRHLAWQRHREEMFKKEISNKPAEYTGKYQRHPDIMESLNRPTEE